MKCDNHHHHKIGIELYVAQKIMNIERIFITFSLQALTSSISNINNQLTNKHEQCCFYGK